MNKYVLTFFLIKKLQKIKAHIFNGQNESSLLKEINSKKRVFLKHHFFFNASFDFLTLAENIMPGLDWLFEFYCAQNSVLSRIEKNDINSAVSVNSLNTAEKIK